MKVAEEPKQQVVRGGEVVLPVEVGIGRLTAPVLAMTAILNHDLATLLPIDIEPCGETLLHLLGSQVFVSQLGGLGQGMPLHVRPQFAILKLEQTGIVNRNL